MKVFLPKFGRFIGLKRVEYLGILCVCLLLLVSSCSKEFINPYDPATPADVWMPRDLKLDTLGPNKVHLFWEQDNRHIDGYVVQKFTNGQSKEYLVFRDTIDFIDSNVVETNVETTCPEIRYEVLARAGRNRSDAVGMQSPIYMPLSTPAIAGEDTVITTAEPRILLYARPAMNGEQGKWSIVMGDGGAFSDDTSPTAIFNGNPCSSYVLRWTVTGCSSTYDELAVNFIQQTNLAQAGADISVNTGVTQVTLNGNQPALGETGSWSIITGNNGVITNSSQFNSTFSGNTGTQYMLRWLLTGACNASADYVLITFE
ncbi:MAG: hypothetical protein ACK5B6_14030 [Bacteroidia bacterium]|jgi:hypothetical protein